MDIAHAMRSEPAYRRKQGLALGPMFVLFAIRFGEAEGKPLGATDISEIVKIPRSGTRKSWSNEKSSRRPGTPTSPSWHISRSIGRCTTRSSAPLPKPGVSWRRSAPSGKRRAQPS